MHAGLNVAADLLLVRDEALIAVTAIGEQELKLAGERLHALLQLLVGCPFDWGHAPAATMRSLAVVLVAWA